MQTHLSSSRTSQLINTLHAILKPFLLRRLKVDIETSLPPKKEYVLYAPLTVRQREVYDRVVTGGLREYLMGKGSDKAKKENGVEAMDVDAPRKLRSADGGKGGRKGKGKKKRKRYDVDGDDDEYFDRLEKEMVDGSQRRHEEDDVEEIGREYQYKATRESPFVKYIGLSRKVIPVPHG